MFKRGEMSAGEEAALNAAPKTSDIFKLAWPMTLKAVFLHGTVLLDGWLVSPLGEKSLAAMGLAGALGGIVLGVIFAFSHALQIRTAQAYGTDDPVYRKSVLASGLTIGLTIGLIGICAIFLFGQSLLSTLATSADISQQAWTYLSIFSLVILGEAIGQSISSHFNGCGRTKIPLLGYCLSVPINVVLSYALIHGAFGLPAFGVPGAAMGSAAAILFQTIFLISQLIRLDGFLHNVKGWQKGTFQKSIQRHVAFSLPIAATFVSATFAGHICTLIYAKMALPDFAAMTLIAPWNMVAGQISMQWTQATGIMVAQLLGKKTSEPVLDRFLSRAWRGAFVAAFCVAIIFIAMNLSIQILYPDLLIETQMILIGFLPILLIIQIPRTTNAICGNTLRASGDTVYVMKLFIWAQWGFRVPATAVAVLYFDLSAFWVLSLILWEELIKFYPFHQRLWKGDWKRRSVAG
ncbi:MAG: MATE family efflux transporter [Lentilitoribacter sp.]